MSDDFEPLVRRLEDFILEQANLLGRGRISFEFEGQTRHGYPYIRSSLSHFQHALTECLKFWDHSHEVPRFLEVGCGLGAKCELARQLGFDATGIDLLSDYVSLARSVFPECRFINANALEFEYAKYDIVFSHVPMTDEGMLYRLELLVLQQLPTSGMLLATRLSDNLTRQLNEKPPDTRTGHRQLSEIPIEAGRIRAIQVLGESREPEADE